MGDGARPFRRPTLPPFPPSVEERVAVLEAKEDHQEEELDGLTSGLRGVAEKLDKLSTAVDSLALQVQVFSDSRKWWMKILATIVGAGIIAMFGQLLRISWFVQANKAPPINP
jgi:uncharacterized coiled-coil protein SlyX